LLASWQQRLQQLGEDFAAGRAAVMPLERRRSCGSCDLAGLCRIGEAARAPEEEA
jgi:hypothetical protein